MPSAPKVSAAITFDSSPRSTSTALPARPILGGIPGSITVNELVERELARREHDQSDRRRNIITLTTRGADTLERLDAVLDDVQNAVLAPLTSRERETLVRLLAKLT